MKHRPIFFSSTCHSQRGAVLIVGLIMMLLLTIIGLAAVRGSSMQELMAGNLRDRNLAFQAAEAGLRCAEDDAGLLASDAVFNGINGLWENTNQTLKPYSTWTEADWLVNSKECNINLDVISKPRYIIEKVQTSSVANAATGGCVEFACAEAITTNMISYRITSVGFGGTQQSQVMLQSTFRSQK